MGKKKIKILISLFSNLIKGWFTLSRRQIKPKQETASLREGTDSD
jgi:hypothetical protein